jgi:YaaC-like Protein
LTGRSMELLDLLRAIPDLSGRLEHFNQASAAFEVTFSPGPRTASGSFKVIASVRSPRGIALSTGFIRDNLAIGSYLNAAGVTANGNDMEWTTPRAAVTELDNVSIRARGSWWLLPKIHQMLIPEYSLFLAALYTLSVFARYIPDYWLKIRDDHTDEWALIRDFVSIAEEKIPWLAVNHFSRATHEFVSPV